MTAAQQNYLYHTPKKYIVRFRATPPNHYDAPAPRLVEAENKEDARMQAAELAELEGLIVSSVRTYYHTHQIPANN